MIVKYFSDGIWGYIDNVQKVELKEFNTMDMRREYDHDLQEGILLQNTAFVEGNEAVTESNKAYWKASEKLNNMFSYCDFDKSHAENHLDGHLVLQNFPAYAILIYLQNDKNFDSVVMVTNQSCYLMNDKGQTIERLV